MARIFILLKLPLFCEGVERMLRKHTEFEIVGRETDTDIAVKRIAELQPDIVLIDNGDPAVDLIATVTRVMKIEPPVKVIGLDQKLNKLHLYHREEREAYTIENLVDAINSQLPTSVQSV
jgi:DNA-binding NarL/FixJ family response regulator